MNPQEQQGLDKELNELKGFIADLKADRASQKEKEQRESWTKYASLSLVFLAVLATVASTYSAKYGGKVLIELNNSTFHQAEASDKWSYFQAKSIKQNLYEALREVSPSSAGSNAAQVLESFKGKIVKYEAEKTQISADAKKLEEERDKSRDEAAKAGKLGAGMGAAVSIFQVALALGSICLVTKKKPLWYLTLGIGALATAKMIMVWMS